MFKYSDTDVFITQYDNYTSYIGIGTEVRTETTYNVENRQVEDETGQLVNQEIRVPVEKTFNVIVVKLAYEDPVKRKVELLDRQMNMTVDVDTCSLDELKQYQKHQIGLQCTAEIEKGISLVLSDGNSYPFSYTLYDQMNYTELNDCIRDGFDVVPYHANHSDVTLYSADDMKQIVSKQRINKLMLLTKCNQLNRMVDACASKEEVSLVHWDTKLTGEYLERYNTVESSLK